MTGLALKFAGSLVEGENLIKFHFRLTILVATPLSLLHFSKQNCVDT